MGASGTSARRLYKAECTAVRHQKLSSNGWKSLAFVRCPNFCATRAAEGCYRLGAVIFRVHRSAAPAESTPVAAVGASLPEFQIIAVGRARAWQSPTRGRAERIMSQGGISGG